MPPRLSLPHTLLIAGGALLPGAAAHAGALSESDFLSDLPVVLSATRLRQPLSETPAAMTVIDREMIRDSGAWDVADLFRLVPGMYVAYNVDKEVVPGHVVSYHGMADPYAKRMQIQIDGRSVYTPLFGGPVWSNIPLALEDIERVEVVRGPSAATYGANSFLGVINIITREPGEVQGTMVSLAAGRPGRDATLRHGGRTERADYRVTLQLRGDNGYTDDADGQFAGNPTRTRSDNKRIGNLSLRSDWRLTDRDELQFQFGYSGGMRETGDVPNNNPRREKEVGSQYEMLRWQRNLGPDEQFSLRFFHNRDRFDENSGRLIQNEQFVYKGIPVTLGVPAPLDGPLRHVAERYDLEAQHSLALGERVRMVWGGGLRHDAVSSPLYMGTSDFRSFRQQNLFGNIEWRPLQKLVLNIGAMVENNSFVGTRTSPRLAANYHLTPAQTVRASVGRAYRNPVLFEQQGNSRWIYPVLSPVGPGLPTSLPLQYLRGQDNLRPERIDSHELGYLHELGHGGALDLKYSYDRVSDLIEAYFFDCCATTIPGTVRTFGNRRNVAIRAFEAQWQQRFGESTQVHFGWASTRIDVLPSAQAGPPPNAYDQSAPRHSQNLLLARQLTPLWRASVGAYRAGPVKAISGDSLPATMRWDLRAARQFRWHGGSGELALVVQNVANTGNREFYADNVLGRRAYASLRFEF